jgi:hypothetical protein
MDKHNETNSRFPQLANAPKIETILNIFVLVIQDVQESAD